ncbi:MAG: serine/threonine-protein kinase [Polyangiaceae bacterium]
MGLDDFRANDVLDGRYQLLSRIGQGGFGDVWRAVELFADGTPFRDVALKLLAPELAGAGWAEEAKLLASFSHPSLVTIFAAGVLKTRDTPFVAMEFLEGETLADVLRRKRRLGWRAALRIARDVAAALDVIHAKGIVHLDLKPANFFVTRPDSGGVDGVDSAARTRRGRALRGTIKVLDFGLSRKQGARPRTFASRPMSDDASIATGVLYDGTDPFAETQAAGSSRRTIAGTPGFVAPEVIEFLEPTSAADAYALGATIVQLVTGHLPHAVDDEPKDLSNPETVRSWWLELREATLRGSLRDLEKEGLPRGLAALVRRLLSVDPTARGCPPGSLFAQLDEVWTRPFGVPLRPFPGLAPFDASYEGVLFGREGDATRMVRDLTYETALVMAGPRGAGKTSLLVAGVLPELAKSEVDGRDDWRAVLVDPALDDRVADVVWRMRPEEAAAPARTLALSATEVSEEKTDEEPAPRPATPVIEALPAPKKKARPGAAAMQTLKSIDYEGDGEDEEGEEAVAPVGARGSAPPPKAAEAPAPAARPVTSENPATLPATEFAAVISAIAESTTGVALVVDPLEALLDLAPSQRKALVDLIHDVVHASKTAGLRFIAAVDSQRVAEVMEVCGFDAAVRAAIRFIDQPPPTSGADIAVGPLKLAGMKIEDPEGLARDVEQALTEKGSLPFLAASLGHWWDERAGKKFLSTARYRELGGVKAALFDQAKAVHDALPRHERAELLALMTEMATTEGKLVEHTVEELGERIDDAEGAKKYVAALVRRYLVRRHGDRVVLADERLIGWPPLEGARLAAMERLAARERFKEAALAWDRSGQRKELLEGRAFLRELTSHDGALRGLGVVETEYLAACKRAARRRLIVGTVLVLATLGLVVGLYVGERFLERQRQEAIAKKEAAVRESYRASLLGRAQQTGDPYEATALIIEAIQHGPGDSPGGAASPQITLELMDATRNLVPARFISRDSVQDLDFPWDSRWVLGRGRTGSVVAIDLAPPKGELEPVEEGEQDSSSLNEKLLRRRPHLIEVRPSDSPVAEIAPFGFDTAFATRGASGEVRVVRLTEDGEAALVAKPDLVCRGKLAVAKSAPVVACTTESGIGAWDLRTGKVVSRDLSVDGTTLSPDGKYLAAWVGKRLHILETASMTVRSVDVVEDVLTAKFAPKEPLLAFVSKGRFEVFDARTASRVFEGSVLPFGVERTPNVAPPSDLFWDEGGLDLTICTAEGAHAAYLRHGGRAPLDVEPRVRCDDRATNAPALIREADRAEYGPLERKSAGMHLSYGGFKLGEGRYLTRSLAVISGKNEGLERATQFVERDDKGAPLDRPAEDAFVDVVKSGEFVAVEHQSELLLVDAKGRRLGAQAGGHLLGLCQDGKIAAWRKDGANFKIFDARTSAEIGSVPRRESLVVGVSPACDKLYLESLGGHLFAHPLTGGEAREIATLDGYVFDRKLSKDGLALVVAVSSGAVARIDAKTDGVLVVGYGTPRASAIASGPGLGEITFADSTGILVARSNGAVDRVLEGTGADSWDDIAIVDDGRAMLLGATKGISVLDVKEREIVLTSKDTEGLTRFTPWDAEGSLLAFNPNLEGQNRGYVVPFSRALALSLGALASNLRVHEGRIILTH